MLHEAKIDFEKVATEIVARHNTDSFYVIKSDRRLEVTCAYVTLRGYSWFTGDPSRKWLYYWREKRNTHLERFGLVPREIELFLLEKTLREHFGEKKCEN